jgi:hypothetical protein
MDNPQFNNAIGAVRLAWARLVTIVRAWPHQVVDRAAWVAAGSWRDRLKAVSLPHLAAPLLPVVALTALGLWAWPEAQLSHPPRLPTEVEVRAGFEAADSFSQERPSWVPAASEVRS